MADKAARKRRIRNTAFAASVVVAAGMGCYFGSRKGFDELIGVVRDMSRDIKRIQIDSTNIMDFLEDRQLDSQLQQRYINAAILNKVPYQHFPGLGVRFESIADAEKIDAALGLGRTLAKKE